MTGAHNDKSTERLPLGVKVAYGAAEGSSSLVFIVMGIYFLIFLTDSVGLSPSTGGAILFAGCSSRRRTLRGARWRSTTW